MDHEGGIGDQPIESKVYAFMNAYADVLDESINPGLKPGDKRENGFILMIFPFGMPGRGRVNYISNADRADVLIMLKEQVARFEGRMIDTEGKT